MFNPNEHMMKLKGKDYLQVAWRIVWLRDEHKDYSIATDLLTHDPVNGAAVFKATIADNNGVVLATGHGSETRKDFGDYLEKAETKAIGRALAYLGYGTQFAPELEEGERIVDSPVELKSTKPDDVAEQRNLNPPACERCGKPVMPVKCSDGRKLSAAEVVGISKVHFNGAIYCAECQKAIKEKAKAQ